jgi:hypothetical protein
MANRHLTHKQGHRDCQKAPLGKFSARQEIEEFVRERLIALKPKTYFPHEAAFCALAVVLESLPMPIAETFLSELAALNIAEMPIGSRVTALCLKRRRKLLATNTLAVFEISSPIPPKEPIQRPPQHYRQNASYNLSRAA